MSKISEESKKLTDQWKKWDKNATTLKEVEVLLEKGEDVEIKKRFGTRISFGTAGLRGPMQAGTNAMNEVTVAQASQGLALYVESMFPQDGKQRGICLGFDGRYQSRRFVDITAATFISRGIKVYRVSVLCATPLLAFCVTQMNCVAGVMVTASHNPKQDNGYKVYWDNGSQIIPPHDEGITKNIIANLGPWDLNIDKLLKSPLLLDPTDKITNAYFSDIKRFCYYPEENLSLSQKYPTVFTAMHGVGKEWVKKAFETFQISPYIPVKLQIEADPEFPTVTFPNPEEGKGALKLSIETAEENKSDFIVANDPDSDRLALAEKQNDNSWKIFNGNEIGILLANWTWTQEKKKNPNLDASKCFVINTTVSSQMLAAFAKKEGLYHEATLTGFKWIGNKVKELENKGMKFIFGFEEAIGFMPGNTCLDKDGVRTAAIATEMKNFYLKNGKKLTNILDELYEKYGAFSSNNRYFFCYEAEKMKEIFDNIRNGGKYTDQVGKFKIKGIRDLTTGYDSTQPDKKAILPISTSSHMITFWFENGGVVTLRGSGTEPKLKYYSELCSTTLEKSKKELNALVTEVIKSFLKPEFYGLVPPKDD